MIEGPDGRLRMWAGSMQVVVPAKSESRQARIPEVACRALHVERYNLRERTSGDAGSSAARGLQLSHPDWQDTAVFLIDEWMGVIEVPGEK